MQFDEILADTGKFGRFQWRIYFGVCICIFVRTSHNLAQVFLAGQSDHWCHAPELDNVNCTRWSLTEAQCIEAKRSVAIPLAIDSDSVYEYENCVRYNLTGIQPSDWFPGWDTSDVTNDTIECDAGWVYDTSQFKTTIITDFDLVCQKRSLPDLAQSMYFIGMLIGSAGFGALSDRLGRYWTYVITFTLASLSAFLTAVSNGYIMYTITRTITGAAWQGCSLVIFILMSEFVEPSRRSLASFILSVCNVLGYCSLPGLAFLIRGWRTLMFVLAAPSVIILVLLPLVTESPRWLISKGRLKEAEAIIRKMAKVNKKDLPKDYFERMELKETGKQAEEDVLPKVSFTDVLCNRTLRSKTLNLMWSWCVISLAYYGLSLSTGDLGGNVYLSFFISGAVELPANLYVFFSVDWLGRKANLSGSMILGGIACLVSVFAPLGTWRTTIAMLGKFFATVAFAIVYIFTTEQYPTQVRNVGLGICSTFGRIGSIVAPLIFIIGDYWAPLPYVVFGACSVSGGLINMFLPETKGIRLPETIQEKEVKKKQSLEHTKSEEDKNSDVYDNSAFVETN